MKNVELKIVSTIKIQTIEGGKKTTRRRFNFDVELPSELEDIICSHVSDVWNEVKAEQRTPDDWVLLLNKHTNSNSLRCWAASIIWFKYGGNDDTVLYRLTKKYVAHKHKVSEVAALLERMGCPRFICDASASREKERRKLINKYRNKTIQLGEKT